MELMVVMELPQELTPFQLVTRLELKGTVPFALEPEMEEEEALDIELEPEVIIQR
jgi:hypothetical protein